LSKEILKSSEMIFGKQKCDICTHRPNKSADEEDELQ
jgi:hypothetical protein